MRRAARPIALLLAAGLALLLAACGSTATAGPGAVRVVAAENFWGSIAAQVSGTKASVQSIIVDPSQDPHSYEPTAADARTLATAQLAIVNGIGYDPWAPKLLDANPAPGRQVLSVGGLLGLAEGDNPHRWYDPGRATPEFARAGRRHPHGHDQRDARPGEGQLRAVAGRAVTANPAGAAPGHGQVSETGAVELTGAAVRLGDRQVLSQVDLRVERGEFVAVIGPNGARKTTLMRAILGLVPPAQGRAPVLGRPPAQ